MLLPRILSAIVLGPMFLGLVYLGSPWFHVLIGVIAAIMGWEFSSMDRGDWALRRILITASGLLAVLAMMASGPAAGLAVVIGASLAVIVADQATGRSGLKLVHGAAPYVGLPALAVLFVHNSGGMISTFWVLAVVWGTDIGAYAFGRVIGGPKLAPSISPKKTWSGALGGLLCGTLASAAVLAGFHVPVGVSVLGAAVFVSFVSEAGDLLESALKRWYDVKDSGALIPGHGGLMDRFDGLWAAAPIAAILCVVFEGGVDRW